MTRELLAIADELRAVATTGLHFGESEHDRERYERLLGLAARLAERAGLTLRPTWVAFTPWTALEDFRDLLDFVERHGLVANVQPVQ